MEKEKAYFNKHCRPNGCMDVWNNSGLVQVVKVIF